MNHVRLYTESGYKEVPIEQGVHPTIWIDDTPMWLFQDSI